MNEVVKASSEAVKEIKVPRNPHMPAESVAKLKEILENTKCFLEYGAGGSTRLAARAGVPDIYSVESDKVFLEAVRKAVDSESGPSRLHTVLADIGPTKDWGKPADNSGVARWPDYPLKVWDVIRAAGAMPDAVLVDGRFRVACTLASLLHAPAGTIIMVDDYVGRERYYQSFTRHVKIKQFVTRCAIIEVPERLDYKTLAVDLARACTQTQ